MSAAAAHVLDVREHRPGRSLLLRSAGAAPRSTARQLWNRLVSRRVDAERELELEELRCDAGSGVMVLREAWTWARGSRRCTVVAADVSTIRVRVAGVDGDRLVLSLTVTLSTVAPRIRARFCVAELDRNDEVVDLALRIARCLGLAGYYVRHRDPADVELVRAADAGPAFRTPATFRPVPAVDEPVDYSAPAAPARTAAPPRERAAPVEPWVGHDGWVIDTWRPGEVVRVSRPGRSRAATLALAALVWTPLAAAGTAAVGGLIWLVIMLCYGLVVLLPALLIAWLLGTDPPMVVAYLTGLVAVGAGIYAVYEPGSALFGKVRLAYAGSLGQTRVVDWATRTFTARAGGRVSWSVQLEHIDGAQVRAIEVQDDGRSRWAVVLEVLCSPVDRPLFTLVEPTAEDAAELKARAGRLEYFLANADGGAGPSCGRCDASAAAQCRRCGAPRCSLHAPPAGHGCARCESELSVRQAHAMGSAVENFIVLGPVALAVGALALWPGLWSLAVAGVALVVAPLTGQRIHRWWLRWRFLRERRGSRVER